MITVEQAGFLSNFINSAPFLWACPAVPDLAATLVLAMILKFYAIGCKMLTVRIHMEICAPYPPGQHQGISICQKGFRPLILVSPFIAAQQPPAFLQDPTWPRGQFDAALRSR
jgi:hypothetical protein